MFTLSSTAKKVYRTPGPCNPLFIFNIIVIYNFKFHAHKVESQPFVFKLSRPELLKINAAYGTLTV